MHHMERIRLISPMQESIAERLQREYAILQNILEDSRLLSFAQRFNYDRRKVKNLFYLWEQSSTMVEQHRLRYPVQYKATDTGDDFFSETRQTYLELAETGRILFKYQPHILSSLGLLGRRKLTYTGFIFQADQFYGMALASEYILQSYHNINQEKSQMLAGQRLYHELKFRVKRLDSKNGAAREMTYKRDQLIDQLEEQIYDLLGYLKIGARGDPEQLKKVHQMEQPAFY